MSRRDISAYIESAAALIALPIPPEYAEGVADNVERLMDQAALVMAFPLDDAIEAASIFIP